MNPVEARALLEVKQNVEKCLRIVKVGHTSTRDSGLDWLNRFCEECWNLVVSVQNYIRINRNIVIIINEHLENVFLCLTQICVCIKYMERTIKAEETACIALLAARQHFTQRIDWCLNNLGDTIDLLVEYPEGKPCQFENYSYSSLIDLVREIMHPYNSYRGNYYSIGIEGSMENSEAVSASNQIRQAINQILGYTLAFANVALEEDKKPLSALCQKVLRECIEFQNECALCQSRGTMNYSNRNLKAMSLEHAISHLNEYMNGALLRLTLKCFLDFEKISIEKLRSEIRLRDPNDSSLDELIADFDINLDRATQLGIFTTPFTRNMKGKIIIRSCLASLESLDSSIIPSLQTKSIPEQNSKILEEHYNEEIAKLKNIILDIADSHALTACYSEFISKCLNQMNKQLNKSALEEIVRMGELLVEHFTRPINKKSLVGYSQPLKRLELFQKYKLILHECQAVLVCANQVETERVLKRFQILRSILRKFLEALNKNLRSSRGETRGLQNMLLKPIEPCNSQNILHSVGIMPRNNSILYENATRRRSAKNFLSGKYTDWHTSLPGMPIVLIGSELHVVTNNAEEAHQKEQPQVHQEEQNLKVCNVHRKDSLRTVMFKRQRSSDFLSNNSNSLQISDILNQLSDLSASMNASVQPKHSE